MKKTKIRVENICKNFGETEVLKDVKLKINEGEIFGIFGPSGCGKTTLLRIISGLEKPDSGKIYLNENEVASKEIFVNPEKRDVAFVFQNLGLWPHMSVREHLEFVLSNYDYDRNEMEKQMKKTLNAVGLNGYEKRKPESLSGGEKQRLALARALIKKSDIFLLDEPLSSLDIYTKENIKKLLLNLQKMYKMTVVYVTHDVFEIVNLCDKVAIMNSGKIVKVESMSNFFKDIKRMLNFHSY
jgi:ABC-type sugar transport system ATPase subunit